MDAVVALNPADGMTKAACAALGLSRASVQRHRARLLAPKAAPRPRPRPPRALSVLQQQNVLRVLHEPRFVDQAPAEVWATLIDEGTYLCSIRTFYRILGQNREVCERRAQRRHPVYTKPELLAVGPNEVWSWDITKLKGPRRGEYYELYLVLDIFSRYVVAWCVAPSESGELAKELIANAVARHQVPPRPAHGARGPWVVDDLEPGGRAAHLPGDRAEPLASAREQRQPLQREPVQDPQVLTSIPGTLRLDPRRPRILRAVPHALQRRAPTLRHRLPHAGFRALRHRRHDQGPAARDPQHRLHRKPRALPPPPPRLPAVAWINEPVIEEVLIQNVS